MNVPVAPLVMMAVPSVPFETRKNVELVAVCVRRAERAGHRLIFVRNHDAGLGHGP